MNIVSLGGLKRAHGSFEEVMVLKTVAKTVTVFNEVAV
jgi:hypothetical protein